MSKVGRVNVAVAVNTQTMDAGISQAKAKLDGLGQSIGRIREGFGKFGLGAVGGFFSAQAFTAPMRAMESFVSNLESAASRAAAAMKAVERGESSFYEQGFTAQGAAFLARNEKRIKGAAAQSMGLSFTQAAGDSGIMAAEAFGTGLRTVGAFAGSMFRQVVEGDITRGNPDIGQLGARIRGAASNAYREAGVFAAPNDWLAQAMQIMSQQNAQDTRELKATLQKLSGTGAPR